MHYIYIYTYNVFISMWFLLLFGIREHCECIVHTRNGGGPEKEWRLLMFRSCCRNRAKHQIEQPILFTKEFSVSAFSVLDIQRTIWSNYPIDTCSLFESNKVAVQQSSPLQNICRNWNNLIITSMFFFCFPFEYLQYFHHYHQSTNQKHQQRPTEFWRLFGIFWKTNARPSQ